MRHLRVLLAAEILLVSGVACAETLDLHSRQTELATTVATSAMWGGLAGGAVSGAFIGYQLGIQGRGGYDWVPVLVTGVGIGVAGGLVWGIVHALSAPEYPRVNGPVLDGMSLRDQRPKDLSGQTTMPLFAGRF